MKYERLTKRDKDGKINVPLMNAYYIMQAYDRLAELEDKIESGKIIELPRIRPSSGGYKGKYVVEYVSKQDGGIDIDIDLTLEEAEARLKELQSEA